MKNSETIIQGLLDQAEVQINGNQPGIYRFMMNGFMILSCRVLRWVWGRPIWTVCGIVNPLMS